MTSLTTRRVVRIAIIAALYAVITLLIAPIAYNALQKRFCEASYCAKGGVYIQSCG